MDFREFIMLEANEYPQYTCGIEIEVSFQPRVEGWQDSDVGKVIDKMQLGWAFGKDQTCQPGIEMKTKKPLPITNTVLQTLETDLQIFTQGIKNLGLEINKNPSRCATHIHLGGLNDEEKYKVAKLWIDGGVQDMEMSLISPQRRKLLDQGSGSYMRRVNSINQYNTIPHSIAGSKLGKFVQRLLMWLKNTLSLDKYAGWDKFYSMSPRSGFGTLEFRTKESTTDGRELAILVKSIAAFCSASGSLFDKLQQHGKIDIKDIKKALYFGGVGLHDLDYVAKRANES